MGGYSEINKAVPRRQHNSNVPARIANHFAGLGSYILPTHGARYIIRKITTSTHILQNFKKLRDFTAHFGVGKKKPVQNKNGVKTEEAFHID